MEVLHGFVVVYVNLDRVIKIIRESDDPKAEIMRRWKLTEVQVEAILNMRLRSLRRLEEIGIKKELDTLGAESSELEKLLGSERGNGAYLPRRSRRRRPNSAATRRSAVAAP